MSTSEQSPTWLLRYSAAAGCFGGALTIIYWWIHPPAEDTAKALPPELTDHVRPLLYRSCSACNWA